MQDEFEISMTDELKSFVGLQITHEATIYIHQTKYVKDLLKKFKLKEAKEMKTPMYATTSLGLEENSTKVDNIIYCQMLGSLPYLTTSRPDIIFNVCLFSRFQ